MKNQRGFSVIEGLLILIIVGLIAGVGYFVYNSQKKTNETLDNSVKTINQLPTYTQEARKAYTPEIPSGWVKKNDGSTKIEYAVPSSWGDEVKVQKYAITEDIHVGYGAPVYMRYSSVTSTWQTAELDVNGKLVTRSENNLAHMSDVKVEDKYITATYGTGHVFTSELRLLVIRDKDVYHFIFPSTCEDQECNPVSKHTNEEIKASIPKFIKTIKLSES